MRSVPPDLAAEATFVGPGKRDLFISSHSVRAPCDADISDDVSNLAFKFPPGDPVNHAVHPVPVERHGNATAGTDARFPRYGKTGNQQGKKESCDCAPQCVQGFCWRSHCRSAIERAIAFITFQM